ncbi:helix-turn-helix domain-containing protein [Paenibacillus sp. OAS669]|uniref:helix-turn-helix domain-containing protein n=1 Tax=Paenibacillus sp. OAS669 TaxID=2663821 RepID=UPI001788EC57|nr:helix-turn-helix domain-containing protein [Paenibacillus sp. OAS669]MBE1446513.1 two-component system response regulator YesN [Paenibacillus sp. OAS669]
MNIVIADDEALVRSSLTSMLEEMEGSWNVLGEAANGEELLDLVGRCLPDIAIVDIKMPRLSGLEAIQQGRLLSPLTQWIIVSGYSEFSFAQQALKLGASEYLLKPVDPEELQRTLHRVYASNQQYIALLNQQFENTLFNLFHGLTSITAEPEDSLFHRGSFHGTFVCLDSSLPANQQIALQHELCRTARSLMNASLGCGMNIGIFALPGGEMASVSAWEPDKGIEARQRVVSYQEALERTLNTLSGNAASVTLMQTSECRGLQELVDQMGRLQRWAELRPVLGLSRTWLTEELEPHAEQEGKLKLGRLMIMASQQFKNKLYVQFQQTIGELGQLWGRTGLSRDHQVEQALLTYMGCVFPRDSEAASVRTVEEGFRYLQALGDRQLLGPQSMEQPIDWVERVIAYIESSYMKDIGISQIAADLNVTPNYLSTLFHKKTGSTFMKYVTRLRILKAKELLADTGLQVQQVAESVGYYSTRHFTKLFTEMVGMYPSDYRRSRQTSP